MIITGNNKGKATYFHFSDKVMQVEPASVFSGQGTKIHFVNGSYLEVGKVTPDRFLKVYTDEREAQRRYELAKAAMQGLLANPEFGLSIEELAQSAVAYADAVLKELQKGGEE